jgi:[glutamine synthetase] adenylyltransferase / [glutamine synthetase]-adenylyl-L-tyrosine phosphorylase
VALFAIALSSRYTLVSVSGARTSLSGWLARMGFADVARAERELASLGGAAAAGDGTPLLAALAAAADPDLALAGLALIAERDPGLVRVLDDDPAFRARLTGVLGVSKALADHLARHPGDAALLRGPDATRRPDAKALRSEFLRAVGANPDDAEPRAGQPAGGEDAAGPLAAAYHRRLLHLAARDVAGDAGVDAVAEELADLADAVLEAALAIARAELPPDSPRVRLAVVAMGKCGARELNYASDIDVIFVAEPYPREAAAEPAAGPGDDDAALKTATRLASGLVRVCERTTPEGSLFPVDPNLRPEGRQGPLVRTLASYRAYYRRWSVPWETQALLRAAFVAGDPDLGAAFIALADEMRYPDGGVADASVREIRRIKARMEAERMPRGMDRVLNLKLGPGGLTDVEWVAQLLQLRHAHAVPALRTTGTLPALQAASGAGLISAPDLAALTSAWTLATRIRDGVMLMRGRGSDAVPTATAELAVVAQLLGYPPDGSQQLAEDWRRISRQARNVMERLFYGWSEAHDA